MPVDMKAAKYFETTIRKWIMLSNSSNSTWDGENAMEHLQEAAEIHIKALSCGIAGFHLLHWLMDSFSKKGHVIRSTITALEAPTYYGMMAAVFII